MSRTKDAIRKVEEAKIEVAEALIEGHVEKCAEEAAREFWMLMGAGNVLNALVDTASVKLLRALQAMRESKAYKQTGYQHFNKFLDHHPQSPMSYDKFHRLEKQLELEGEAAFETMNALGVPMKARALLKGHVTVEGDRIIIGEEGQQQVVPVRDRERVIETVRSLAVKLDEQRRTIERHKDTIRRGQKENEKLQRKLEAAQGRTDVPPFTAARTTLLVAFDGFLRETRRLPMGERKRREAETYALLTPLWETLYDCFGYQTTPPPLTPEGEDLLRDVTEADLEMLNEEM